MTKRRTLPGILILLITLCLCTIACAEHSGTWGNLSWKLDNNGTLTISGKGVINDFSVNSNDAWRAYEKEIKKIVVNKGITRLGDYAFTDCGSDTVTLPSGLKTMGISVFSGSKLTSINLPKGLTFLDDCVFSSCQNLTSLTFPEGLKKISWACCDSSWHLKTVKLPTSLEAIEAYGFQSCIGLQTVYLPKGIKIIKEGAFCFCESLKDVYYGGTKEERDSIIIQSSNDELLNANWHYGSQNAENIGKAKISTIPNQVYTGKSITPKLTIKLNGLTLKAGIDYTVAWKNNINISIASGIVTGKGSYTGKKTVAFTIIPKTPVLSSLKSGKNSLTVKWKKATGIDGLEIEYSLQKSFKGAKKITVVKAKTEYEIKKLKAKKIYYIRIRAFKKVKGKMYLSEWSKVLSKKTN